MKDQAYWNQKWDELPGEHNSVNKPYLLFQEYLECGDPAEVVGLVAKDKQVTRAEMFASFISSWHPRLSLLGFFPVAPSDLLSDLSRWFGSVTVFHDPELNALLSVIHDKVKVLLQPYEMEKLPNFSAKFKQRGLLKKAETTAPSEPVKGEASSAPSDNNAPPVVTEDVVTPIDVLRARNPAHPLSEIQVPMAYRTNPQMQRRRAILEKNFMMRNERWQLLHRSANENHARAADSKAKLLKSNAVQVIPDDWGNILGELVRKTGGEIPAVLNLADAVGWLGFAWVGGSAQEEQLALTTTSALFFTRGQYHKFDDTQGIYIYSKEMTELINADDGVTFLDMENPRICFRKPESDKHDGTGYEFREPEECYKFWELRCAAKPMEENEDFDEALARKKIEAQFRTALKAGVKNLILMPFGCGAFKNPPERIAAIYREVILSEEFQSKFDNIIFAVNHPDSVMMDVFYRTLHGVPLANKQAVNNPSIILNHLLEQASWLSREGDSSRIVIDVTNLARHHLGRLDALSVVKPQISEHPVLLKDIDSNKLNEFIQQKAGNYLSGTNLSLRVKSTRGFSYLEIQSTDEENPSVLLRADLQDQLRDLFAMLLGNLNYALPTFSVASPDERLISEVLIATAGSPLPEEVREIIFKALLMRKNELSSPDWVELGKKLFGKVLSALSRAERLDDKIAEYEGIKNCLEDANILLFWGDAAGKINELIAKSKPSPNPDAAGFGLQEYGPTVIRREESISKKKAPLPSFFGSPHKITGPRALARINTVPNDEKAQLANNFLMWAKSKHRNFSSPAINEIRQIASFHK